MYTAKKTGSYSFTEIMPEPVLPQRWQWTFFHPNHNPEHEHVALFLLTEHAFTRPIYDCYHFGVDKARQFLGITDGVRPLRSIRIVKDTERVLIHASVGEIAIGDSEPDGYGSCLMQKWYEYSYVEFDKMYSEFERGFKEMGWSR